MPSGEDILAALRVSPQNASLEQHKIVRHLLKRALPAACPKVANKKLHGDRSHVELLTTDGYVYALGYSMVLVVFYSDTENLRHNKNCKEAEQPNGEFVDPTKRKWRKRVLKKHSIDQVSRFYYGMVSSLNKWRKEDEGTFVKQAEAWEEEIYREEREMQADKFNRKKKGRGPKLFNIVPSNHIPQDDAAGYDTTDLDEFLKNTTKFGHILSSVNRIRKQGNTTGGPDDTTGTVTGMAEV